ncbi:MAG: thiamine pyrophosphate-binding protein [Chloroflexi bacterium]|nr:thiamine pyrophosphate-binding protein [Chloroflexota bacterium]
MSGTAGSMLVARALQDQGADAIFTIVAGPVTNVIGACGEIGVRPIGVRHEQGASFMAIAHGYVAGKVGVVMTGSGPGVTNTVTGVHVAWDSGYPLLVLGGSAALHQRGRMTFQEADSVAMMQPITKWAIQADSAARIPELIAMGYHKALSGRPGPVYIDLPLDVLREEVEDIEIRRAISSTPPARPQGDPLLIEQAAELLLNAERPLLIVGKGVRWAGDEAFGDLQQLVEDLGVPFLSSPMGRGYIPDDHALNAAAARSQAMRGADVVMVLAARLNWMFQMGQGFAPDAKLIQVDIEAEEIGLQRDVDIGIAGDAGQVLRQLHDALEGRTEGLAELRAESPWRQELRETLARNAERLAPLLVSDKIPISHYRLMHEITRAAPRDAIITVDGEITMATARQVLQSYGPATRLNSGTNACIGTGVPFAIGAKLARPEATVISVNGDSAFGFNGMEIETALRHDLPVVFIVDNNQGILGSTLETSLFGEDYPERVGMYVPEARYDRVMEAFGGHAEHVERPEEIAPALERALGAGRAALIDVAIDPEERQMGRTVSQLRDMGY